MLEPNFESHDGIIDPLEDIPDLGRYVDFGGFWSDDYCLTIDHLVYEDRGDERPEVRVRVNGKDLDTFMWHIDVGDDTKESLGIRPSDEVHREDDYQSAVEENRKA